MMTVSIVSLAPRSERELMAVFAIRSGEHIQKESFLISAEFARVHALTEGECDRSCYEAVEHHARVYHALKCGMRALSFGTCSPKRLLQKLTEKGMERSVAREAIRELCRLGYMNPSADALREAERCVAKEWGKKRIVSDLYAKGYSESEVRDALFGLEDAEVDFSALCAERIRKQVGVVPSEPVERQKLVASLERYGFSYSEIREAFRQVEESV